MTTHQTLAEIEETAARWIIKRDSEHWTGADQVELERWLDTSVSHRDSFVHLQAAWDNVGLLKRRDVKRALGEWLPATARRSRRWELSQVKDMAIAASLLLGVALAVGAYLRGGEDYSTPVGGHLTVPIDGSVITLNTDTELRVRFSKSKRYVRLIRGEAFFQVNADPERPFTVQVGDEQIVVLGTEFSVWDKPGALHVAVVSGSVRVAGSSSTLSWIGSRVGVGHGAVDEGAAAQTDANVVTAGMVAEVDEAGTRVSLKPVEGIERDLAWRQGLIEFNRASLPEAIAELNRYHTQKMVIADSSLATITLGGVFYVKDIDEFLGYLRLWGVRTQVQGDRIVLTDGR